MGAIETNEIQSWFAWIQETYPTSNAPALTIAPPEYDTLGDGEGNAMAFGVFIPDENRIVMLSKFHDAQDAEEEQHFLFTSLAHEYCHHLQWLRGEAFAEQETAEQWMQPEHVEERPAYELEAEKFSDDAYAKWVGA